MKFQSIQVMRGLAALAVVLYHIRCYLIIIAQNDRTPFCVFGDAFGHGALVFFSISGFLMAHLIDRGYRHFLVRRLLRIYPTYWAVALASLAVFYGLHGRMRLTGGELPRALSLLPFASIPYPLDVEWTLVYEVFFYGICALFAAGTRREYFPWFLCIWFGSIMAHALCGTAHLDALPDFFRISDSLYDGYFVLGGLTYYAQNLCTSMGSSNAILALIAGAAAFLLRPENHIWMMFGIACVLLGAVKLEPIPSTWVWRRLVEFGDQSYSLYLVHVPVITTVLYLRGSGVCALVAALLVGWGTGRFDLGVQDAVRRRFASGDAPDRGRWPGALLASALAVALAGSGVRALLGQDPRMAGADLSPRIGVESPAPGTTLAYPRAICEGWYLSDQGGERLEVLVDGEPVAMVITRLPRFDLVHVIPGYHCYQVAGFRSELDTSRLKPGAHIVTVRALGVLGLKTILETQTAIFMSTADSFTLGRKP